MAARSHLFPFRTEKLSSLSPMVLNFGRVGSRRFQESISLRLTPFFVRVRAQKPAAGLGQPPSPDSCPLRRLQSVTVVRERCVTFGDGKILNPPPSTIHHQPFIITIPSFHFISYICDNIIIISSLC